METLKNQPEKVVYKEKPAEAMSENPPMSSEGNPKKDCNASSRGMSIVAKILKQKANWKLNWIKPRQIWTRVLYRLPI